MSRTNFRIARKTATPSQPRQIGPTILTFSKVFCGTCAFPGETFLNDALSLKPCLGGNGDQTASMKAR